MTSIIKVDQIQTAAGTNPIDHERILTKDDGYVVRQVVRLVNSTGYTYTASAMADGPSFTFTDIQPDSYLSIDLSVPFRNDSASWGGMYMAIWHTIDGGATWRSMGTTGHEMMAINASIIMTYKNTFLLTPQEIGLSSAGDITFKLRFKSYDGTMGINNGLNHDVNYGGDSYQNGYSNHFWTNMVLREYALL